MAEMTLAAVARGLMPRADQPGVFSGYASLFGTVDSQGDRVERGAFRAALEAWRANGRRPAMLWQHDHAEPIGLWTQIEEDATGLRVEGRLLLAVRAGAEAYEHLKAGTVSELGRDEIYAQGYELQCRLGVGKPAVVVLDPTDPTHLHRLTLYGALQRTTPIRHDHHDSYSMQLIFEEWL
ncbi:MAG: HK97 family phage prohead protease [Alphaproteobacteria bacterium]|nr:HK97 family phage prohead protease [Alphaproteobacteria bacterium]